MRLTPPLLRGQGRFLLTGAPMANRDLRQTLVTVLDETKITVKTGNQEQAGTSADLKVGAYHLEA